MKNLRRILDQNAHGSSLVLACILTQFTDYFTTFLEYSQKYFLRIVCTLYKSLKASLTARQLNTNQRSVKTLSIKSSCCERRKSIRNKMFVKERGSVRGQVSTRHRTHHLQCCVPAREPLTQPLAGRYTRICLAAGGPI